MGTPNFAVASLDALIKAEYNIISVVTTPDKPAGRGQKLHLSAVKEYALVGNLPLMQPVKLNEETFIQQILSLKPDLIIVVAFRMLPESIWSIPTLGTINLHASLLPKYRGAAPINYAIINGETQTGVTTFFIDKEIDTGKILFKDTVEIHPDETAGELHDRLMMKGASLLVKTIQQIETGNYHPIAQSKFSTLEVIHTAPKIKKDDCKIRWDKNARDVHNFIRGLSPYPAAFTILQSPEKEQLIIKIFQSSLLEKNIKNVPGSIQTNNKNFLHISCKDGWIAVSQLQLAGKKRLTITEFLKGFPIKDGWSFV